MKNFSFFTLITLFYTTASSGQIYLSPGASTSENFDVLGTSASASLPSGWKIDKLGTVRTVGTYSSALNNTEMRAGNNMAGNSINGIYNFTAGDAAAGSDRSAGWNSSSTGTQSGNLYLHLNNSGTCSITEMTLAYEVEKYRNGSNSAGFSIQLYYSSDGAGWTNAGASFTSYFPPDAGNNGFTSAPGQTVLVSSVLTVIIPPGSDFYLAWNYSVVTGSTASNAQALGIDNFQLTNIGTGGSQTSWNFRTTNSGAWNSVSVWEASADGVSCWSAATSVPYENSASITIRDGHSIVIDSALSIDQITIEEGATLIYDDVSGSVLSIGDGMGTDLTINGTFYDSGPENINWNAAATWALGNTGTIVFTRGGTSSNNWRDRYDGGISSMPPTANWIIRKTGTTHPEITTTGGMYYPNLTIENFTGSTWTTSLGSSFSGNSDFPRIKGNFDVGGTGTAGVNFLNDCKNTNPVLVTGTMTVRTNSTFRNYGTGLELQSNLEVDGIISYDSNDERKIKFTGSGTQSISGSGLITAFQIEINKTSGTVVLNKSITVDSSLLLTSGKIISSSSNVLLIGSSAVVTGACDQSYVEGPVVKSGNSDFTFPIGKDGRYRPIGISGLSAGDDFTAEYYHSDPEAASYDISALEASLHHVGRCEYWILKRAGSASARVALSWDDYSCGVSVPADLTVAHWENGIWRDEGNGGTTGNPDKGTIISQVAISNFSPFTLASRTGTNPLPLRWGELSATREMNLVKVRWRVFSQINNDYFTVEKSNDGKKFEAAGRVNGAGNHSSAMDYEFTDYEPFPHLTWYRIRQTDFDGKNSFSSLIITNEEKNNLEISTCYTDLNSDKLCCNIYAETGTSVIADVINLNGQTVISKREIITSGNHLLKIDTDFLTPGVYILRIIMKRGIYFHRVIK